MGISDKRVRMKIFLACILAALFAFGSPITLFATGPNTTMTFAFNRRGWLVRTQDAYLPYRNITTLGMNQPTGMVFGNHDLLYIADTGNRRVIVFDARTEEIHNIIEFEGFQSPRGVFVTAEDWLYVADARANAVFILCALTGEHIRSHYTPTAMAFADTPFSPNRIAVDLRGNMFIVGEGVYDGVIQLSNGGEFLGFFAANRTTRTFIQMLQDIFFTERQRNARHDRLPGTFSNVTVDNRGVVYSVSILPMGNFTGDGLKRHDMAGRDTFDDMIIWGLQHIDLCVDARGFIYTVTPDGWIYVFTNRGEMIFYFGAGHLLDTDIAGLFRSVTALAVSSAGDIWVLDDQSNFLQSFRPTEYTRSVFEAITLFNAGLYEESAVVWEEVLRHNQMSVLAHTGMGRAQLHQENFAQAMESFYLGGHRDYYSTAFWEVRNQWLMDNLTYVLFIVAGLFLTLSAVRHLDRRRVIAGAWGGIKTKVMDAPFLKPAFFAFSVARHPIDSYYYIKLKEKGSTGGAVFHFILLFTAYMAYQTSRGFLVQFAEVVDMDFIVVIGGFFGLFILFIISNYLVTSIYDGEGGIVDIFKLVSYGMFPMTITLFGVTALSHVITQNELFLLHFAMFFGIAYTVSVLWLGFQEIHNYGFKQTLLSLIVTACFMVIAVVVLFNLSILLNEVREFIESIVREVYAHVTGMY
ncbi:MAG: YIP1 family protein [Defluviitaleaceae bacterium]|nr:YIP1 family protein [Defluviitaleaceae bacterium]